MKPLLRLAALPVILLVAIVLVLLVMTWIPAWILFGEPGVDRVMAVGDRVVDVALRPFERAL